MTAVLERDSTFDGVFFVCVKTTGIFCRPTCPARKPRPENVEFFSTVRDCLSAGFRPCKRCRPLEPSGTPPAWLRPLLEVVEGKPRERITDADLGALGLEPVRVRRWFQKHHGMTFHAYHRARRLGLALGHLSDGDEVTEVAHSSGFESASGFREAFERWFGDPPGRARDARVLVVERILTPLGPMVAAATGEGLALLEFADRRMLETQVRRLRKHLSCRFALGSHPWIEQARSELDEYFEGRRKTFDVALELPGTPFQRAAWEALLDIPYGETRSYEAQAKCVGRPGAYRAVGRANGDNRIAILVPCHRVIQRNGSLSGYGGGLWRKRRLLELERANARKADADPT